VDGFEVSELLGRGVMVGEDVFGIEAFVGHGQRLSEDCVDGTRNRRVRDVPKADRSARDGC
jgi:hypothetical protein